MDWIKTVLISFLFLLGLKEGSGKYGSHDLFTSLAQIHELWKNELTVVDQMDKTIVKLEQMTKSLKQ